MNAIKLMLLFGIFVFLITPQNRVLSSTQGSIVFNATGKTTDASPTLTGTIPSFCDDVAIVILDDYDYVLPIISELHLGVDLNSGNWSVSLSSSGVTLPYGYYHVYVSSKCGSASYNNPVYSDIFLDSLYIVPPTCWSSCGNPIHRFYNFLQGAHFYTNSEAEKRSVMEHDNVYRYEGIVGFSTIADPITLPVYRFYNFRQGVHFYTTNYDEYINVLNNASWTFRYEGIGYWALRDGYGGVPVHRFYKFKEGLHFYTANQSEASLVNDTMYSEYRYEGIAYYLNQ